MKRGTITLDVELDDDADPGTVVDNLIAEAQTTCPEIVAIDGASWSQA